MVVVAIVVAAAMAGIVPTVVTETTKARVAMVVISHATDPNRNINHFGPAHPGRSFFYNFPRTG
jgi:hypothetical protein